MDDQEPSQSHPPGQSAPLMARLRRFGAAGPLAAIACILPPLGGFALLGTLPLVGPWLKEHGALGLALYIAGFIVFSGFALLPTYAQAILGGWAFGVALGFPAALAGFLGGALIGYAIARRAASDNVMEVIREKPTWLAVRNALVGRGFWKTLGIVALLRLPPNSPFALTNLVMGSTRVPPVPFVLGTAIGMSPRTLAAVFIASQAKSLIDAESSTPNWVIYGGIGISVIVVLVIGRIANDAIRRVAASPHAQRDAGDTLTRP